MLLNRRSALLPAPCSLLTASTPWGPPTQLRGPFVGDRAIHVTCTELYGASPDTPADVFVFRQVPRQPVLVLIALLFIDDEVWGFGHKLKTSNACADKF